MKTVIPINLVNALCEAPQPTSVSYLVEICRQMDVKAHLAILNGDYISKILSGSKKVESRFSKSKIAPFHKVSPGHVLILKQSSGSLLGIASVTEVSYFGPMNNSEALLVLEKYYDELQIDQSFIEAKKDSKYATLMYLEDVISLPSISLSKIDRRSWIVLFQSDQDRSNGNLQQLQLL